MFNLAQPQHIDGIKNSLYTQPQIVPKKAPDSLYKPPDPPKQNYEQPTRLYYPPEKKQQPSSYNLNSEEPYAITGLKSSYEPPSKSYLPPTKLNQAYEAPEKETNLYESALSYKTPKKSPSKDAKKKIIGPLYKAPHLKTSYEPPSGLYTPPKENMLSYKTNFVVNYKTPKPSYKSLQVKISNLPPSGQYGPPEVKTPLYKAPVPTYEAPDKKKKVTDQLYEVPDLLHLGYASLLGPTERPGFLNPAESYKAPKKISAEVYHIAGPSGAYNPPDKSEVKQLLLPGGYDYSPPLGYKADSNPTLPKISNLYEEPQTEKPSQGYIKPPSGYDYTPPNGYDPSTNPTFPRKSQNPSPKVPTFLESQNYRVPRKKDVEELDGYTYKPPAGYDPSENPTFPKEHHQATKKTHGFKPPNGYDYTPPQGYSAADNPTFPKHPPTHGPHVHDPTFPTTIDPHNGLSYSYGPAPEGRNSGKPRHSFNIIIKDHSKPHTQIRIQPEGQYGLPDLNPEGHDFNKHLHHLAAQEPTSLAKLALRSQNKVRSST